MLVCKSFVVVAAAQPVSNNNIITSMMKEVTLQKKKENKKTIIITHITRAHLHLSFQAVLLPCGLSLSVGCHFYHSL